MRVRVRRAWEEAQDIRGFELVVAAGETLPSFAPGAHLELALPAGEAEDLFRHYSIASDPTRLDHYRIAVLREPRSRGGSRFMHEAVGTGDLLDSSPPRNDFSLEETAKHTVLIAGGIGITPLIPMVYRLRACNASFELHYAARSPAHMAFRTELAEVAGSALRTYFSSAGERLRLPEILATHHDGTHLYVCGPRRLILSAVTTAPSSGWPRTAIHLESFGSRTAAADRPVEVVLRRSGMRLTVPVGVSILDALLDAGVFAPYECKRGECSSCATPITGGEPDHRDVCLTPEQRQHLMCTCVSWCHTPELVLDL